LRSHSLRMILRVIPVPLKRRRTDPRHGIPGDRSLSSFWYFCPEIERPSFR
jgi:hypothetical protein